MPSIIKKSPKGAKKTPAKNFSSKKEMKSPKSPNSKKKNSVLTSPLRQPKTKKPLITSPVKASVQIDKKKKKSNKSIKTTKAKAPVKIAISSQLEKQMLRRLSFKKKRSVFKNHIFRSIPNKRGVVFIKHLPHGFYEDQLKSYFTQFGTVTRVRVARSQRTTASKGFAFVEFQIPEVAQIAAETMNNYLMFNKKLETSYIPPESQKFNYFVSNVKKYLVDGVETLTSDVLERKRQEIVRNNAAVHKSDVKPLIQKKLKGISKINKNLKKKGIIIEPTYIQNIVSNPAMFNAYENSKKPRKGKMVKDKVKKLEAPQEEDEESDDSDYEPSEEGEEESEEGDDSDYEPAEEADDDSDNSDYLAAEKLIQDLLTEEAEDESDDPDFVAQEPQSADSTISSDNEDDSGDDNEDEEDDGEQKVKKILSKKISNSKVGKRDAYQKLIKKQNFGGIQKNKVKKNPKNENKNMKMAIKTLVDSKFPLVKNPLKKNLQKKKKQ